MTMQYMPDSLDREPNAATPGEWYISEKRYDKYTAYIRAKRSKGFGPCVAIVKTETILPSELDANARLIAAAPELLAAMRECLSDLQHYVATHGPGPDKRLARVRDAIAKAEATP